MTIKDFIREATTIAQKLLEKGDHEGYQKAMAIIADAIYEAQLA